MSEREVSDPRPMANSVPKRRFHLVVKGCLADLRNKLKDYGLQAEQENDHHSGLVTCLLEVTPEEAPTLLETLQGWFGQNKEPEKQKGFPKGDLLWFKQLC